jgi:hypothetical protein
LSQIRNKLLEIDTFRRFIDNQPSNRPIRLIPTGSLGDGFVTIDRDPDTQRIIEIRKIRQQFKIHPYLLEIHPYLVEVPLAYVIMDTLQRFWEEQIEKEKNSNILARSFLNVLRFLTDVVIGEFPLPIPGVKTITRKTLQYIIDKLPSNNLIIFDNVNPANITNENQATQHLINCFTTIIKGFESEYPGTVLNGHRFES